MIAEMKAKNPGCRHKYQDSHTAAEVSALEPHCDRQMGIF
jgi:hypothetical protein